MMGLEFSSNERIKFNVGTDNSISITQIVQQMFTLTKREKDGLARTAMDLFKCTQVLSIGIYVKFKDTDNISFPTLTLSAARIIKYNNYTGLKKKNV